MYNSSCPLLYLPLCFYWYMKSAEDVPDPRELSSEKKNLMVFDDLWLEKQKHVWIVSCQEKTQLRWLLLFSSKLFQAPTPNNQREREFHVCFSKTWRTLTIFSKIMWEVTWLRKNSDNYARQLGKTTRIFL